MTVALADHPDMLDPTVARTLVGRMVFRSMCEKLYDIDQKLNVVPQLAASRPAWSCRPKQLDEPGADFGSSEPSNFWHHGQ
jgi:peptide/nickel transport system substrate-binding protein